MLVHDCELFLNGLKIPDLDLILILALIFRFGVILDVKFSRVFIRCKDTHWTLI